jgi:Domain of unknown function (DUF4157)/Bacterial protein of unknown function (DUF922)
VRLRTAIRASSPIPTRSWGVRTATVEPERPSILTPTLYRPGHHFAGLATSPQRVVEISRAPQTTVQRQADDKPESAPESPAPAAPTPENKPVNTAAPEPPQPLGTTTDASGTTTVKEPPTIIYDEYSGATLQDVASALPKEPGSATFDIAASTEGEPVSKSTINVTQEVHLPKWKERDTQCAAVQKAWDDLANALKLHEDGHVSINQSKFANGHRRYKGQSSGDTQKVTDKIKKEAQAASDEYDDKTQHGLLGKPPTILDLAAACTTAEGEGQTDQAPKAQAKLEVSEPGDPYELEADRVADQVMRMADPYSTGWMDVSAGRTALQRKCAECEEEDNKKEEGGHIDEDEKKKVQRKASGPGVAVPERAVAVTRSGGELLDAETRAFMEPRFGFDFNKVRIHADSSAADAARSINARAYTLGSDVTFAAGQYSPRTGEGRRLLAHELTHVVQQSAAPQRIQREELKENSDENQRKLIDTALKSKDAGDVKAINPFRLTLANVNERYQLLDVLLNHNLFVGPRDGTFIESIWRSFGKDLPEQAATHFGIWKACNDHTWVNLYKLPDLFPVKTQFRTEIAGKANSYLKQNREEISQQQAKLGLNDPKSLPTDDQSKSIKAAQDSALKVQKANDARRRLEYIQVVYELPKGDSESLEITGTRKCVSGFNPEGPFPAPGNTCIDPTGEFRPDAFSDYATWAKTKEHHTKLTAAIDDQTKKNPMVFALYKDDDKRNLDQVALGDDQTKAREAMADSLTKVLANIGKTEGLVQDVNGEFILELWPIHKQLLETVTWKEPFHQAVAKNLVDEYQEAKFWDAIGVGTMQAALFVVAALTGGGAAVFLLGINALATGAQAAASWDKFMKLDAAAHTNLSETTALVNQGQADAQFMDAILMTAFAFIEAYGALGAARSAGAMKALAQAEEAEAKQLARVRAGAKNAEAVAERVQFRTPTGEIHEFKLLEDGRILRCSDFCDLPNVSFRKRLAEVRSVLPSNSPARQQAAALVDEARALERDAAAWKSLPDAEKQAQKGGIVKRGEALEIKMAEAEKAALPELRANAGTDLVAAERRLEANPRLKGEFADELQDLRRQYNDIAPEVEKAGTLADADLRYIAGEKLNNIQAKVADLDARMSQRLGTTTNRPYAPSPKHAPGGWGTPMDLDDATAQTVLNGATPGPNGRQMYGFHNGKLYEFQPDNVGGYHGYPVPGTEVPPAVLRHMENNGVMTAAQRRAFSRGGD